MAGNDRRATASGPSAEPSVAWEQRVGGRLLSDPLVADSLVYAVGPERSQVRTVEAAVGERTTVPALDAAPGVPAGLDGDRLCLVRRTNDGPALVGRRVDTGERIWTRLFPRLPTLAATVADGTAVVPTLQADAPAVHAIDIAAGTGRWRAAPAGSVGAAAVDGGLVVFSTDRYLFALDAATGERRWNRQFDTRTTTDPLVTDAGILVGTEDGTLVAVDRSGEVRWRRSVGDDSVSALARFDGAVAVGCSGHVTTYDPERGDRLHRRYGVASNRVSAGPDRLYAAGETELVALAGDGLERVWTATTADRIVSGPVVLSDAAIVRTRSVESRESVLVAFRS
jgi:outer membrane protein assembly factor BamB